MVRTPASLSIRWMVSIIASSPELGPGSEINDPVLEPLGRRAIMHQPTAPIEQCVERTSSRRLSEASWRGTAPRPGERTADQAYGNGRYRNTEGSLAFHASHQKYVTPFQRFGLQWNGSHIGMKIKERIHTLQKPRFDFFWRAVHDVQCHATF